MSAALVFARDSRDQTVRHLRALWRQPWWIVVTLMQPIIWLLLFGALFEKVVEIPGFTSDNYLTFLAPGVVVMTALFSSRQRWPTNDRSTFSSSGCSWRRYDSDE